MIKDDLKNNDLQNNCKQFLKKKYYILYCWLNWSILQMHIQNN